MALEVSPTLFNTYRRNIVILFVLLLVFDKGLFMLCSTFFSRIFFFAACLAFLSPSGCRFDTQGLEGRDDSGIMDASPDSDIPDAEPPLCIEDRTRCNSTSPRIEICINGEWVIDQPCEYKCLNEPEPKCGNPVFQNGIQAEWLNSNNDEFIPENPSLVEIDTDTKAFTVNGSPLTVNPKIITQDLDNPNLPEILVATFRKILIHPGVRVVIKGGRALALGSKEDLFIFGQIEAGADAHIPGPGGSVPGAGPGFGQKGSGNELIGQAGGGGGGHLAIGGKGGESGTGSGGSGGQSYGAIGLSVLAGGSGGGSASNADDVLGTGGAGGGVVMFFSLGEIAVHGSINAGGGGGYRGGNGKSGGGGGSGGAILLEAPWVTVLGAIASNGGGGGGGDNSGDGENGRPDNQPASGGNNGGRGGAGSEHAGSNGGTAYLSPMGGGGGACGRIRIRTVFEPVVEENGLKGIISPEPGTIPVFSDMRLE